MDLPAAPSSMPVRILPKYHHYSEQRNGMRRCNGVGYVGRKASPMIMVPTAANAASRCRNQHTADAHRAPFTAVTSRFQLSKNRIRHEGLP